MSAPTDAVVEGWYKGRIVVVTGAYGYLGTGLCNYLRFAGARIRRATRGRAGLENDAEAWVGDLTDPVFCKDLAAGADAVFHMAGQTSIAVSHEDPIGDLRANVESTLRLLEACSQAGRTPAFIHSGTATEIGVTLSVPIAKDATDRPATVYDADKLAAENLIGVYTDRGAVHGLTLRIANVYGPGAAKSAADRGVTNKMIAAAMAGRDLAYYGDGALVRDYVYVDDLLEAFLRSAVAAPKASRRSFVAAGGKGYSLSEAFNLIADVVAETGRPRVGVQSAPWPENVHPIDRRSFVGDVAPLEEFCEWRPTTSLRDGIRLTVEAFEHANQHDRGA